MGSDKRRVVKLLPVVVTILLAYVSAMLVGDYLRMRFANSVDVKPRLQKNFSHKEERRDYSVIWKVFDRRQESLSEGRNITGGQLVLLGLSVGDRGYAIIKDSLSKKVFVVRTGERVMGLRVVEISRDRVVFEKGDQRLFLTFVYSKAGAGSKSSLGKLTIRRESDYVYTISRALLFSEFSNVSKLLTKISVVPYIQSGEVQGYLIRWISRYSVLRKMGLRTGDIVREINGIPLKQPQDIYNIMKSAMASDVVKVRITRANRDILLEYDIR